jgi:hypothetical protein
LTLQLIQVMDSIWLNHNLDLKMTPYKTLGTDCMQGLIEWNQNCSTLTEMQISGNVMKKNYNKKKDFKILDTFNQQSVYRFMKWKS